MCTILGEHISLIRPSLIKVPTKAKDVWRVRYNTRPKTRKIGKREFKRLVELFSRGNKNAQTKAM
uniref:Uncharacterized protein n=1 Tax=viral metagenome TaxID=1070528 RepID=A0A6M3X5N9_9ZZZZ